MRRSPALENAGLFFMSEFIPFQKKSQYLLLRDLNKLLVKLYVRLDPNSEESDILVKIMDISKDLR